jgi:hypothetical protein
MAQQSRHLTESELATFVDKIRDVHSSLPLHEQQLFGAVLLTAAGEGGDVQAYGLDGVDVKRAAFAAVIALGLGLGGLSAPMTGAASAATLSEQGGGHQGGGHQLDRTHRDSTARHWAQVPDAYRDFRGPRFDYQPEWYFHRHISHPSLYVILAAEPEPGQFAEYYFYNGSWYAFVGS